MNRAGQPSTGTSLLAWSLAVGTVAALQWMSGTPRACAQAGASGWTQQQAPAAYAPPKSRTYQRRPTLSPYLDLLRIDSGVLPPYHAFVVPRRRIEQQQARQWQAIGQLQRRSESMPEAGSREPLPTGGGGRFQTYLHYYPLGGRP